MRKGLQILLWGVLGGVTTFLAILVKQKNAALDAAQTRLAQMEQKVGQLAAAPAVPAHEDDLRAQLAASRAETAQLAAQLATMEAAASDATRHTAVPLDLAVEATQDDWQAKAPALAAAGRALDTLPTAKLPFANQAIQARILPAILDLPQDLSAVDGIGAIYEQRLYNAGIGTYWELASLDDAALKRILKLENVRKAATDLDAIRAAARRLDAEQASTGSVWRGGPVDDFEPIKGIGAVYEQRLYNAGIRTYAALAATAPEQLLQICHTGAPVAPDVASWIEQARRRAAPHD